LSNQHSPTYLIADLTTKFTEAPPCDSTPIEQAQEWLALSGFNPMFGQADRARTRVSVSLDVERVANSCHVEYFEDLILLPES